MPIASLSPPRSGSHRDRFREALGRVAQRSLELVKLVAYALLSMFHARSLRGVQDNTQFVDKHDVLLFSVIRNESARIPYFLDYYRSIGVDHFFFIDNGSTDDFAATVAECPDVSVWYTDASYRKANCGLHWSNALMRRHADRHWVLLVDPDEFLVFPYDDRRNLKELTNFLDSEGRRSFFCILIDMYGAGNFNDAHYRAGDAPLDVCPYFDAAGYTQKYNPVYQNIWVQGGVRQRVFFREAPESAPAQNKMPLVKWRWVYSYISSTHIVLPTHLNEPHAEAHLSPTGALLHFKLMSSLREKAEEEMVRGEHFGGSVEYRSYLQAVQQEKQSLHFSDSVRYRDWRQLEALGLLNRGQWF